MKTLALAILSSLGATVAAAERRVAVAWDDEAGRALRALEVRPPFAFVTPTLRGGRDASLRFHRPASGPGSLFVVSRAAGTVERVDPRSFTVLRTYSLGAGSEPVDIALAGADRAYVTRARASRLLRLDLDTGATAETVDLGPFSDPDGVPDLGLMEVHQGRLFIQVRRIHVDFPGGVAPPYLAVVDLATEELVDADPERPGTQAIALQGTFPKQRMQVLEASRRLLVSATGGSQDAGGLEVVDLDTLRSRGLLIREADGRTGADLGAFVVTGPEGGFLVYTTDFDLSSHLARFTLEGEVEPPPELHVTVGYFMPSLVHEPTADLLFVPEGAFDQEGVLVFDARTGERRSPLPSRVGGRPTDTGVAIYRLRTPLRGDCNGDGEVVGSVTDAVFLLQYGFTGGKAPPCAAACDANGDGEFLGQVTDAVHLLSFAFLGGPPPGAPFPACGEGAEADAALGCGAAGPGC